MEHIFVYRDESLYCAFPDIVKLQNGELFVGFREAPRRKIISHWDPRSRAVLVRSKDGGKTWGKKTVIYAADNDGIQDPSIMQLRDGTILSNFFTWRFKKTREELGEFEPKYDVSNLGFEVKWTADLGTSVVRSSDNGHTWEEPPVHIEIPSYRNVSTSAPALECNDGTILLPVYSQPVFEGSTLTNNSAHSIVMKSRDKGRTWEEPTLVSADSERKVALEEPTLVQLKSGKIICMMRADTGGGDYLRQAESPDNGKTWTKFWKTSIMGHPPHLLQLSDGRVLCTYGYRHQPFGIRACISNDEGKTWDLANEIIIRDDGLHTDLGYPSSAELEPGKILTVYYFHDKTETRFIAGTFYSGEINEKYP